MKLLKYLLVFGAGIEFSYLWLGASLGILSTKRGCDPDYLFSEDDEYKVVQLVEGPIEYIKMAVIIRKEGKES